MAAAFFTWKEAKMVVLSASIEIRVCADDKNVTVSWVNDQLIDKVRAAVGDSFAYPLSVDTTLQDVDIISGEEVEE